MTNRNEQKFYSALKDVFVGEKVEGESGYVNLMKIKNQYFEKIKPFIENEINETISDDSAREELFEKLYTFFESYFSDTGTPFFDKTQLHKNLYEKVYTERDDVSLFWKTQKLYYVKSEANYTSMDLPDLDGIKFVFDASEIEHQKSNEKKSLEFYLTDTEESKLTFKVRYVDNSRNKWDRIKNYLDKDTPAKVRNHLAENLDDIEHGSINVISNSLDRTDLRLKFIEDNLIIKNNDDSIESVDVEFAISKLKNLETYFAKRNIIIDIANVKKAFTIYKKQNEVDYFIHKDAEGFLKEQFDIYLYNYLFGEGGMDSEWQQERINDIQNIKKIAHTVIEYIARFEDELKAIWEKPKFVRNSNYVFTLDRIKANIELIEKIINHDGFEKQVEEWKRLYEEWFDGNGKLEKQIWKEFNYVKDFEKDEILSESDDGKFLNTEFDYLLIDTVYFNDIKDEILDAFIDLEKSLDGYLIQSENFQAIITLQNKYRSNIDLIYIDPPFNTGEDFIYKDKYQDSSWLTLMHNKIELSAPLLKNSGSFYLHLDYNANFYGRILLNDVFGNSEDYFKSEIVFKRTPGHHLATGLDVMNDTIFWYSKTKDPIYNQQFFQLTQEELDTKFPFIEKETGRRFNHQKLEQSSNVYSRGETRVFGDRELTTELGWRWTQETIDDRTEKNPYIIYWTQSGRPRYKVYSDKYEGRKIGNLWNDIKLISSNASEAIFFQTQKPEDLMKRIINQSSNENSVVMDYFSGSGTTIASAHKLRKNWIGVEMGEHFYNKNLPRLKKVLAGDQSGISKDMDVKWKGGGFFKYYELEQFEDALRLAKYNPKDDDLANVNFQKDEKLLDAVEIDRENENVKIHFETLYPDVDIAETLSNLLGKKIKKLNSERVIFEDDMEIVFDEMTYEKYPWVKPLIWWKSK